MFKSNASSAHLPLKNIQPENTNNNRNSISGRNSDFWLLGGASILLYVFMFVGSFFRENSVLLQQKYLMLAPMFGLFSILCNNPHFIISYKFGYSRGIRFILHYWFSLLLLPIILMASFASAYFFYDSDISQSTFVTSLNQLFESINIGFRWGLKENLGKEFLSLSIWFMYLTVGWHYSKQVYGCLMVYDKFDNYGLGKIEKRIIKYSLLSLAFYQFLYSSSLIDQSLEIGYQDSRFSGINIIPLGLPTSILSFSKYLALSMFLVVVIVFIKKYFLTKKAPSSVFIVVWLSLYFWWVQFINLPEYYYLTVPFFHSLQYLPFAFKMENKNIKKDKLIYVHQAARIVFLLILGFLFFEFIPFSMDKMLQTDVFKTAWFFMISFSIFINIHHFFIDSVVWRLDQKQIKLGLLN